MRSQTGPCPAGVPALPLSPAPRKGTECPAPAHSGAPGSPWAGGDKSGWHLPGMQGGCWPGKGVSAHAGSRASRAAAPGRPPPLRSLSPSARCRPGAAAGEGARVRVCVCARVCAAGSLQHLCTEMRSSLCRRRSLAGWVSAWRRAPAPPFPSSPASPHLLPVFKGRAASSVRLGRLSSCAAWPLPPPSLPSPALKGWRGCGEKAREWLLVLKPQRPMEAASVELTHRGRAAN